MARQEPDLSVVGTDVDLRLRPTCIACGNTRTFYVNMAGGTVLWNTVDRRPEGARIAACGRCRSRNSVMTVYSD